MVGASVMALTAFAAVALGVALGACASSTTGPTESSRGPVGDPAPGALPVPDPTAVGAPSAPTDPAGRIETATSSEDERGAVGVPPPQVEFCTRLGYRAEVDGNCYFPDGTSCEQWDFYRLDCGREHTYCNTHGGEIAIVTVDHGSWTSQEAVCTLGDRTCTEDAFVKTGKCE